MISRQLYEPGSSTYTYLLGCPDTHQAVLLDPVIETLERDLAVLTNSASRLPIRLQTLLAH